MHVWPTLPSGTVASRAGTIMAGAIQFEATVRGRGGHAAMPHLTADPVVAAAAGVGALQALVARETSPFESAVVSVTRLQAGDAFNVIPDQGGWGGGGGRAAREGRGRGVGLGWLGPESEAAVLSDEACCGHCRLFWPGWEVGQVLLSLRPGPKPHILTAAHPCRAPRSQAGRHRARQQRRGHGAAAAAGGGGAWGRGRSARLHR